MKSPRTSIILALSLIIGQSALASPVGKPSSRPKPGPVKEGGTNTGGGNRPSAVGPVTEWCRGSVGILRAARQQVGVSLLNSDYPTAIATYRSGMVQAISRAESTGLDHSLTLKALYRSLAIGDALYAAMIGAADREVRVVDFYNVSYDFIIKVAEGIDIPLYIPYVRSNRPFDVMAHESKFAEYGVEQLKFVLDNFTYESPEMYYAQFNDVVYLTLAELITKGVASDLSQSLFANVYACQVQDLEQISIMLARHNSGDKVVYGGRDRYAVNSSVAAIKDVIKKLNRGCAQSAY